MTSEPKGKGGTRRKKSDAPKKPEIKTGGFDLSKGRTRRFKFASILRDDKTHITVSEISGRDLYNFLKQYPTAKTRYAYYRDMMKFDPALKTGSRNISLLLMRSYRGPALDTTNKAYVASQGFSQHVEDLLSEMRFGHKLGSMVRNLIRDGNVYYRIHRNEAGAIQRLEYLPAETVTILSDEYLDADKPDDVVISSADIVLVNEDKIIKSREALDKLRADPDTDVLILDPNDVLIITWESEDGLAEDQFGRMTRGLIGSSPLETVAFFTRVKLAALLDYSRWLKLAMPRWFATIDLSSMIIPEELEGGTRQERIEKALEQADELFEDFKKQFYYKDDDEESPTYEKWLPPEPDDLVSLSDGCSMDQKGGASLHGDVSGHVQICDRAEAAVLGVPMTMLGYDQGTTYASARVTETFMAGFGGGLIREIETSLIEFLREEFRRRAYASTEEDWENLFLDYLVDDGERKLQEATAAKTIADKDMVVVQTAGAAYTNGMVKLKEARKALKAHTEIFADLEDDVGPEGDLFYSAPVSGMPLMGGSMTRQAATSHEGRQPTLEASMEDALDTSSALPEGGDLIIEAGVYRAHKDEIDLFLEQLADEVEDGDFEVDPTKVQEAAAEG